MKHPGKQLYPPIDWQHGLAAHCTTLVACSGGIDSTVLLHLSHVASQTLPGCKLVAVGIDHGLRAEAGAELEVVAQQARAWGIPWHSQRVVVHRQGNRLAQARRSRYRALWRWSQRLDAQTILLGHHLGDQAETVLWHLCRGTSLHGMAGMRRRTGRLVRPLLGWQKSDILRYAVAHGLRYTDDPSNHHPQRMRAIMRQQVQPALQQLNPQSIRHIGHFAELARADERLLTQLAARQLAQYGSSAAIGRGLTAAWLHTLPAALLRRVIGLWLRQQHLAPPPVAALLALVQAMDARQAYTVCWQTHRLRWDTLALRLVDPLSISTTPSREAISIDIGRPGQVGWGEWQWLRWWHERADGTKWSTSQQYVLFDRRQIGTQLTLRAPLPGDRLKPWGHPGSIKVGDLFTNLKIPQWQRAVWPLLFQDTTLLWVVGLRRSCHFALSSSSQQVVVFEHGTKR